MFENSTLLAERHRVATVPRSDPPRRPSGQTLSRGRRASEKAFPRRRGNEFKCFPCRVLCKECLKKTAFWSSSTRVSITFWKKTRTTLSRGHNQAEDGAPGLASGINS